LSRCMFASTITASLVRKPYKTRAECPTSLVLIPVVTVPRSSPFPDEHSDGTKTHLSPRYSSYLEHRSARTIENGVSLARQGELLSRTGRLTNSTILPNEEGPIVRNTSINLKTQQTDRA
jgi:hypothetical protein